jgi:hypothetical protein
MPADDYELVLDVDGNPKRILRDKHRMHVPMYLRDGQPNPSLSPTQYAIASRRHRLSDQELASCRPGHRYGARTADRQAMSDAKAEAYSLYDAEIGRAYLTPEGFGGDPRITGAGSHSQRQEPPAGSPCTRNGYPGVWRRDDDGQMVCDITAAAGRADAARSRPDPDEEEDDEDERSVAQAAADHQQRMARIYDALDQELRERCRTP